MLNKTSHDAWANKILCAMRQRYNFVALLVNPKPVAYGINNMQKTHPILEDYNSLGRLHAELHCLLKASEEKIPGSTIFIWRKKKSGFGMAKPCPMCEAEMRQRGVAEVIYSLNLGFARIRL